MDDKIKKKPNWRQKADSLGMNYQLLSEEEAQKLLIMENRQFRDEIKELKAVNKQLKQSLQHNQNPPLTLTLLSSKRLVLMRGFFSILLYFICLYIIYLLIYPS